MKPKVSTRGKILGINKIDSEVFYLFAIIRVGFAFISVC